MITVKFLGAMKSFVEKAEAIETVEWQTGITPADLLQMKSLQLGLVGLILVDGKPVSSDTCIDDQSIVEFYPIFGGG